MYKIYLYDGMRHYVNDKMYDSISFKYWFTDDSYGYLTFNSAGDIVRLDGLNSEKAIRAFKHISTSLRQIYNIIPLPIKSIIPIY